LRRCPSGNPPRAVTAQAGRHLRRLHLQITTPPYYNSAVQYYAHSANSKGEWEPLARHLEEAARLAGEFAGKFGERERAQVAGLLHDLGKYGDRFQAVLRGEKQGVDHWSAGAWVALKKYRQAGVPVALAVQGHHIGLQQEAKATLQSLNPMGSRPPDAPELSETDVDVLLARLAADGLKLPDIIGEPAETQGPVGRMLDVRMLFSALVDADFLATEAHFEPERSSLRAIGERADPVALRARLEEYLAGVRAASPATDDVRTLREDLLAACVAASEHPPGLYTLTAPTGSGKTLALLAFALRHWERYGRQRLVVVLPFLSIIEQTAAVYREALKAWPQLLIEDHSLAGFEYSGGGEHQEISRQRALLAENWDAPIIITTSVQFLESLFSNSPAACRKLHRLVNAVVIFDEVQTLPLRILIPTLAALSHLCYRYGVTVIFATATQPAFDHLDDRIRKFCPAGWRPSEIAPPALKLFERTKRVAVEWPRPDQRTSLEEVAEELSACQQAMCVVNVKGDAQRLYELLCAARDEDLFHLSTFLCPQHRKEVLAEVQGRLVAGKPCLLVATQCVEAGVDLDFPVVYRAVAPLDAIAQAAGRCNRNGRLTHGRLRVFHPADARYPSADYRQAALLTLELLALHDGRLSVDDPDVFRQYYRRLYDLAAVEAQSPELLQAIEARNFVEVRRLYRVIEEADAINILTPYQLDRYEELAAEVRRRGLSKSWMAQARPFTVSLFRPRGAARVYDFLEPVRFKDGTWAQDWFIHLRPEHYHHKLGLQVPQEMELMLA
jgi:CRISPR-associated helicase Cas3/CRISPR-associated endonuclease Cas3-HD